jgi:hypothetical protein
MVPIYLRRIRSRHARRRPGSRPGSGRIHCPGGRLPALGASARPFSKLAIVAGGHLGELLLVLLVERIAGLGVAAMGFASLGRVLLVHIGGLGLLSLAFAVVIADGQFQVSFLPYQLRLGLK